MENGFWGIFWVQCWCLLVNGEGKEISLLSSLRILTVRWSVLSLEGYVFESEVVDWFGIHRLLCKNRFNTRAEWMGFIKTPPEPWSTTTPWIYRGALLWGFITGWWWAPDGHNCAALVLKEFYVGEKEINVEESRELSYLCCSAAEPDSVKTVCCGSLSGA